MNPAKPGKDHQDALTSKLHQESLRAVNPAKRYLDGLTNLPPSPTLMTDLLALFRDPDHDVDRVVQLISYEPSLTAQILRTCNSAYFAREEPPGDIFEAVSRVGFYHVYCLVVSVYGAKTKKMSGANRGVDVEALWRHSVAVAVSASVVAEAAGQSKAMAFTAGLLHDIGKLVLAAAERELYARVIQKAKADGVLLSAVERSTFKIDHAELGGELMLRWKLPPEIVIAVRRHNELELAFPYQQLTAAVQVGDAIARQLFGEVAAHPELPARSSAALEMLKLRAESLPRLVAKAQGEMEKVKGMLEM